MDWRRLARWWSPGWGGGSIAGRLIDETVPLDLRIVGRTLIGYRNHILKRTSGLGEFYFDALRRMEVQAWVNREVQAGYAPETVRGWFNILRTLVRDAMADLDLTVDPSHRVALPELPEHGNRNALTPEQLRQFLAAMKAHRLYRRNYALAVVLAFTGLRFSHASALKWEDLDFEKRIIHIVRKQVHGAVGPVSRKKRAPREFPLHREIAAVLREHRT